MDIKILSCFHKEFIVPKSKIIIPIHVGKAISSLNLNMIDDNRGINISKKNKNYCELTAMYWAWKNLKCDIIGLTHYRRYFDFYSNKFNILDVKKVRDDEFINSNNSSINENNIKNILNNGDYDIVVPKRSTWSISIGKQYESEHDKFDLDIIYNILKERYPEYIEAFEKVYSSNRPCLYNMFIMRKKEFDNYCEWLFDILFEAEKYIDIKLDTYQVRVFGFLSERLLNIYIEHNHLKTKELPIIFINNNKIENLIWRIKRPLSIINNKIKFGIGNM